MTSSEKHVSVDNQKVSRLIFGTATYGVKSDVAWRIEEEEALNHLQVSLRAAFERPELMLSAIACLGARIQYFRYIKLLLQWR